MFGTAGLTVTDAAILANGAAVVHNFGLYTGSVTETISAATVTTGSIAVTGSNTGTDKITITDTGFLTGTVTVTVGSATNNTVSVTLGATATTGGLTVNTTTGISTITVSDSQAAANAVALNTFNVGMASLSTSATYDSITGFGVGTGTARLSDVLNFGISAVANAAISATAVSGNTTAQLAVSVGATGMLSFTGTIATATTTQAAKDTMAIAAYNGTVAGLLSNNTTVAYDDGVDTLVFAHTATKDALVRLVGITGSTELVTTNAGTASKIFVS